jgi:hypothetical protein
MSNDLGQLDKGLPYQSAKVWLGPTLGWVQEQVRPEVTYTTSPITLGPKDSIALINVAGPATVNLPDVIAWMKEPAYNPYASFERSLWIKDMSGAASSNPITIAPVGPHTASMIVYGNPTTLMIRYAPGPRTTSAISQQTIDGQTSTVLAQNFGIVRLYPRNDLVGWYIG